MDKTLSMKLLDYYVLNEFRKENIKENKSSIKAILIRKELRKIKKSIANMVDNNTLTFDEFYKLFKILEKSSSGKICIKTTRFCYEDDDFVDNAIIDGISIIKDDCYIIGILFDYSSFFNECGEMIKCDKTILELLPHDISIILLRMRVLCEYEYDKLISLIIAYLIEREIK